MGYGEEQMAELKETLERVDADVVLAATPIDLGGLLELDKPVTRVRYELAQVDGRPLAEILAGVGA
jgi:predicted GTPase